MTVKTFPFLIRHLKSARVLPACLTLLFLLLSAMDGWAITATRKSSSIFFVEKDSAGGKPTFFGMYVAYQITNDDGINYNDVFVTGTNFTGSTVISLAPNEDGLVSLGALANGASKTAFFFLKASAISTASQNHTIEIYDGFPGSGGVLLGSPKTFTFTAVEDTIAASANKVTGVSVSPASPTLGGVITITVTGETGTIGASMECMFTPACFDSWDAKAFELLGTTITFSGGNTGTFNDELSIIAANSANTAYTAAYRFRAVAPTTGTTPVSPIGNIASGTQVKHTDLDTISGISAIPAPVNTTSMADKTSSPTRLTAGGNVNYTLTFTNTGSVTVTMDRIEDTLPSSPANMSYVANSSTFNGAAIEEPAIVGQRLTWSGAFDIPASSVRTMTFTASAPNVEGSFTNRAVAFFQLTQIDKTLSTSDNSPATHILPLGNLRADIVTSKTGPASVYAGTNYSYTITASNSGPDAGSDILVSDQLPTDVTFVSATGGGSLSNNFVVWPSIANMDSGASTNFTLTVTAPVSGPITNIVSSTASSLDSNSANNNGSVAGARVITTITPSADVIAVKSGPSSVNSTNLITYSLSMTNSGPSVASDVILSDQLPSGVTFVSASNGGVHSAGVVTWPMIPSLNAGSFTNYTLTVQAPVSGSLTNIAYSTASTFDANSGNNNNANALARVITTVIPEADVVTTKSGPATANARDILSYTIQVSNNGPAPASGVVVMDTLPSGVEFVSASGGGSLAGPNVTWPAMTLNAGVTTNLTLSVYAPYEAAILTNAVSSISQVSDPDPSNNNGSQPSARVVTTVTSIADVITTKLGPTNVIASENIIYSITTTNAGPSIAQNVVITDTLPAGVTFVSASGGGSLSNNYVVWPSISSLNMGTATNLTVTVTAPTTGILTNFVASVSSTSDMDLSNNNGSASSARVITTVTPSADVAVAKTGPSSVNSTNLIIYSLSITNNGPSAAQDVVLTDQLPPGVTFVSATGGGTYVGGVVTWPTLSAFGIGATTNYTLTVEAPISGTLTNIAYSTAATMDESPANNSNTNTLARVITTVVPQADVVTTKTGPATATARELLSYTITVENNGPAPATGIVVTDVLPAGIEFSSASGGGSPSGGSVIWPPFNLSSGSVTNFNVDVHAPYEGGIITNSVSSTSSVADPVSANNNGSNPSARVITTITSIVDVITMKSGPSSSTPAENIIYSIITTNTGPSVAENVVISDTLPPQVTFVSASDGGLHSGGVVTWPAITSLTNSGSVTRTVTVQGPATGSFTNFASSTSDTLDLKLSNNDGSSEASRVITQVVPTHIAGYVYIDANSNGFRDGLESGTGLTLHIKLVPSGTPSGPAILAASVNSATGAYMLNGVSSGIYTLVLDDNSTLSDVAPLALPSGWVAIENPDRERDGVVVATASINNQNFGLLQAISLRGSVFEDTGSGTMNNGIRDGGENGISGVTVMLTGAVTNSTTTDGSGNFIFYIPATATGALQVVERNPSSYRSTGAEVGNTSGAYDRITDTVSLTITPGVNYTGINFGDVPDNLFTTDGQQAGLPGSALVYTHTFTAKTIGTVTFSTIHQDNPVYPGWNHVLYRDANCNGIIDSAETVITGAISMNNDETLCIVVKEFIPAGAPMNAQDKITVTASFNYTGASPALIATYNRTDLTTVGDPTTAGLTLVKAVDKASALPNETITYTITYMNNGVEELNNVVIYDSTPAYTVFSSAGNGPLPANLTGVTIATPAPGATGAIQWSFTGTLAPGSSGTVYYSVVIE